MGYNQFLMEIHTKDFIEQVRNREEVFTLGRMVTSMKENGSLTKEMVLGYNFGMMEVFTVGNGNKICNMAKDIFDGQTKTIIKANLRRIKNMVEVCIPGKMDRSTKGNGVKTEKMEQGNIIIRTNRSTLVCSKMVRGMGEVS